MRPLIRLLRVRETSMRPALEPGDRLVMVGWGRRPRAGAIVVIRDPDDRTALGVKRVDRVEGERVFVRGDNANVSRDSRHYGALPWAAIVGRVVYRYAPGGRRGRVE